MVRRRGSGWQPPRPTGGTLTLAPAADPAAAAGACRAASPVQYNPRAAPHLRCLLRRRLKGGEPAASLDCHDRAVWSISAEGACALSGGADGVLCLSDLQAGAVLQRVRLCSGTPPPSTRLPAICSCACACCLQASQACKATDRQPCGAWVQVSPGQEGQVPHGPPGSRACVPSVQVRPRRLPAPAVLSRRRLSCRVPSREPGRDQTAPRRPALWRRCCPAGRWRWRGASTAGSRCWTSGAGGPSWAGAPSVEAAAGSRRRTCRR